MSDEPCDHPASELVVYSASASRDCTEMWVGLTTSVTIASARIKYTIGVHCALCGEVFDIDGWQHCPKE